MKIFESKNIFQIDAFSAFFEYTISEQIAYRSSRLKYDERVCLASASDGLLQSVEYRLRVGRKTNHETCYDKQYTTSQIQCPF